MRTRTFLLLIILLSGGEIVRAQTCPPGPPASVYDGSTSGTFLPNSGRQFNFEYARTAGFDCFETFHAWFPAYLSSPNAISPNHAVLDMAYATDGTATFTNVVVPSTGNYLLALRYAYASGLFPNIRDRPEGIKVNGSVITEHMHFPITYSFNDFDYSSMIVPLHAGRNSMEIFNVTDYGVSRLDTMVITSSVNSLCSDTPSAPLGLTATGVIKSIDLKWRSSTWPTDCAIRYYDVYRSAHSGLIPSTTNLLTTRLHTNSYADTTAQCGTTYYYLVQAVDTAGGSASVQVSATTKPCG